jgi:hypothetical protein
MNTGVISKLSHGSTEHLRRLAIQGILDSLPHDLRGQFRKRLYSLDVPSPKSPEDASGFYLPHDTLGLIPAGADNLYTIDYSVAPPVIYSTMRDISAMLRRDCGYDAKFDYPSIEYLRGDGGIETASFIWADKTPHGELNIMGACLFERAVFDRMPDAWLWIYCAIFPKAYRINRMDLIVKAWPEFCERFGAFAVMRPLSRRAERFLMGHKSVNIPVIDSGGKVIYHRLYGDSGLIDAAKSYRDGRGPEKGGYGFG